MRRVPMASLRSLSLSVLALSVLAACASDAPSGVDSATTSRDGQSVTTGSPDGSTARTTRASSCNGTLGAVSVSEVFVPVGASCTLDGTRVRGDVKVARDGSVSAIGARIEGNIEAEDARRVSTSASTVVDGDVQAKRRAVVEVANTTITGNLQVEEAGASLLASGNRITGDVQVKKAESASIATTFVRGDLQLEENRGMLSVVGADVRGDLQVVKNRGGAQLVNNRVSQTLECKENAPAPTGSGNVAGEKKEQCRAL